MGKAYEQVIQQKDIFGKIRFKKYLFNKKQAA